MFKAASSAPSAKKLSAPCSGGASGDKAGRPLDPAGGEAGRGTLRRRGKGRLGGREERQGYGPSRRGKREGGNKNKTAEYSEDGLFWVTDACSRGLLERCSAGDLQIPLWNPPQASPGALSGPSWRPPWTLLGPFGFPSGEAPGTRLGHSSDPPSDPLGRSWGFPWAPPWAPRGPCPDPPPQRPHRRKTHREIRGTPTGVFRRVLDVSTNFAVPRHLTTPHPFPDRGIPSAIC